MRKVLVLMTLPLVLACQPDHNEDPPPEPDRAIPDAQPSKTQKQRPTIIDATKQMMGTEFKVSVAGVEPNKAKIAIKAALEAVADVESRLSTYNTSSDVARINAEAGGSPVEVSVETIEILEEALRVSRLSKGAFDITYAALSPIWRRLRERPPRIPTENEIQSALSLVGYGNLVLDRTKRTAFLQKRGMKINLGGIGKGHGVDKAGKVLIDQGIQNFIVGGGGDLLVRGDKQGTPWLLGIQHPRQKGVILGTITLDYDQALVTSGDYERFIEIDGTRYHHIIDPRSGHPASRGAISVTLTAPNATLADAMATAVLVLGPTEGMELVERTEGVEALIIDREMNITMSEKIRKSVKLRSLPVER